MFFIGKELLMNDSIDHVAILGLNNQNLDTNCFILLYFFDKLLMLI